MVSQGCEMAHHSKRRLRSQSPKLLSARATGAVGFAAVKWIRVHVFDHRTLVPFRGAGEAVLEVALRETCAGHRMPG